MKILRAYIFPLLLILSLICGGVFGYDYPEKTQQIKGLGTLFINFIFITIVPLIFFSVSSAISKTKSWKSLSYLGLYMLIIFMVTGSIASLCMLIAVKIFPITDSLILPSPLINEITKAQPPQNWVEIFSVSELNQLLSHHHILALIIFSILVGAASIKNEDFSRFLNAGEAVFMKVFSYIMYYAPIGFFAYFASIVSDLGPQMIQHYMQIVELYYGIALFYFIVVYSILAYWAGYLRSFWQNIFLPATTALATCSSAATIPANLKACADMGVAAYIRETVIPLGTLIHKEGSIMGGILKISFLFGIYHMDFSGLSVYALAWGVSMLVGSVMGAIPSGGMLGELLILAAYGFPAEALISIAAISIMIDPIATLLNVCGNTVSSLLIAKVMKAKS